MKRVQDFEALEPSWRCILGRVEKHYIFQTFEWNYTWWKCFGDAYHLNIIVVETEEEILAIWPLMVSARHCGPISWRKFEFIGKRFSNYHDILIPDDLVEYDEVLRLLFRVLLDDMEGLDYAALRLFPDGSRAFSRVPTALATFRPSPAMVADEPSYLVAVQEPWEAYLKNDVPRKYRYDTERQIRRLKEQGNLRFVECKGEDSVTEAIAELIQLKTTHRRSLGEASFVEEESFQEFEHEIGRVFLDKRFLFLHKLTFDGRTLAVNFSFNYRRHIYCHVIAYDIDFDRRFSPGRLLQYYELEKTFGNGSDEFDFAWLKSYYKDCWCNRERSTSRIYLFRNAATLRRLYLNAMRPVLKRVYLSCLSPPAREKLKRILGLDP